MTKKFRISCKLAREMVTATDGDQLSKGGKPFSLDAARTAIQADLKAGTEKLPFQVEGHVLWLVVAQAEDRYVICLIDRGWVDPAPRSVTLRAQTPGTWAASDRHYVLPCFHPLGMVAP
jgi:hypothetical protein